jgi:archaellum biogenesis ATPase FlaH
MSNKFKFTIEYQFDLLRYIVLDKNGVKALDKVDDTYFTLTEHSVIAFALKEYHKKNKRIPGETILRERVKNILNTKQFVDLVTKDEQADILKILSPLFTGVVKDGDEIYNLCKQFSSYVKMKDLLENVDIDDFNSYQKFSKQISVAIEDQDEVDESHTSLLFGDIKERQFRRQEHKSVHATPFRQINALTNAGGYEGGSIIVLLDKEKKGKTGMLVNIARGYARMKKNILYIDLENGKEAILTRLEQSFTGLSKLQVIEGANDKRIQKKIRKYKRLGSEIVVERLPALTTNADSIQALLDRYYRIHGIRFDVLIVDYLGKMGSLSNKTDDFGRISDAYMDVANLCDKNKIEHCWTANHVTREGAKTRMNTKYESTDIAKCIDIVRHVHAIYGLNRTEEEEAAGFMRMELVEQRDGKPKGRAVFNANMDTQQFTELGIQSRRKYDNELAEHINNNNPKSTREVSKNQPNIKSRGDLN